MQILTIVTATLQMQETVVLAFEFVLSTCENAPFQSIGL